MLLTRLYELSQRLERDPDVQDYAPPMYSRERVRWYLDLDQHGALLGFTALSGEGKRSDLGRELDVPALAKMRGIALHAKLLADNGQYVLGITAEGKKAERAAESHRKFKELVTACAAATGEPAVQAVQRFLEQQELDQLALPEGFNAGQNLTFRVGETIPVDLPSVQAWWAEYLSAQTESRAGTCCVTGRQGRVIQRLPQPIKRIPGGQTSGLPLISMNAEAFESYGLEASYNAPVSLEAAERCGKALNWLLASEQHSLRIGPLAYVFWTREKSEFNILYFLSQPDERQVRDLLTQVFKGSGSPGQPVLAIDPNDFYAAALSASGSRVVVRDWVETTVSNVKLNLARWFACQDLCDPFGQPGRPLGIFNLVASAFRDMQKENPRLVARFVGDLLHVALAGGVLPGYITAQALRRCIAEQGLTQPRARLIKLWLASQQEPESKQEDYMTELELTSQDPAYLCGRLLAELEATQVASARPKKLNSTIVDRFYGTACTAPASVFGTLLKEAQAHLSKLRKTKEVVYNALSKRIEEIVQPLAAGFPKTLTMKQQALFSLGYYHQRAYDRAQAKARAELKDLEPDTATPEEKA